jgi:hypothetical protein
VNTYVQKSTSFFVEGNNFGATLDSSVVVLLNSVSITTSCSMLVPHTLIVCESPETYLFGIINSVLSLNIIVAGQTSDNTYQTYLIIDVHLTVCVCECGVVL